MYTFKCVGCESVLFILIIITILLILLIIKTTIVIDLIEDSSFLNKVSDTFSVLVVQRTLMNLNFI